MKLSRKLAEEENSKLMKMKIIKQSKVIKQPKMEPQIVCEEERKIKSATEI